MTPKIHIKKDMVASTFNSRTSEVDINRCGEAIFFFEKMCQPHFCSGVVNQYNSRLCMCICVCVYFVSILFCIFVSSNFFYFHPTKTFTLLLFITSSSVCSGVHRRSTCLCVLKCQTVHDSNR